MKFSKELTNYNVNVAFHTLKLDFKYLHAEERWTCPHCRCLHDIPKNARSQAWFSAMAQASLHCQRVYEKDPQEVKICTSILDRCQNDEVFHASQLQHNWTKAWCEYLDYVTTIDISHTASPERYAALHHFRYDRCIIFGTIRNKWRKVL